MDDGQVGFHNNKAVRTVRVEKRINEVVNRLNRTKVERKPDLKAEGESVNATERAERKLQLRDKTSKKVLDPVAPVYKYCVVSISNILTTTCQYEALKYVSFPVQTLAKCAKMIPVMIWGTIIMQKKFKGPDYFLAVLVTLGCSLFILFPGASELSPYRKGRESTV